jgi:hypothetical protein
MYTFNYGYMGSRTTGNGAACFMVAGPRWKGEKPEGIAKVFRSETDFSMAGFRTQLFNPGDIENVRKIQAGYRGQTLSQFQNKPAPPPSPEIGPIDRLDNLWLSRVEGRHTWLPDTLEVLHDRPRIGFTSHKSVQLLRKCDM